MARVSRSFLFLLHLVALATALRMENIKVAVRARPLNQREVEQNASNCWVVEDQSIQHASGGNIFCFDHVYSETAATDTIYQDLARPIVDSVMEGINGTVFAYGQTSSGKTYTMMGDNNDGVIPRAIRDIFRSVQQSPNREFLLRVSFLEIYNEVITDLLEPNSTHLKIKTHPQCGTYVHDLTEKIVVSPAQTLQLMRKGEENRHIGVTDMNEHSSRSHTIFRLVVESRERGDPQDTNETDGGVSVGTLSLVDLAGSERVAHTNASNTRLREGSHINRSLLTLGTVIRKLVAQSGHVPYRDSKLTHILEPALGGNSRTSIICNITTASIFAEVTLGSLNFANRAKNIRNDVKRNEIVDDQTLIKRLRKEINNLKGRLTQTEQPQQHASEAMDAQKLEQLKKLLLNYEPPVKSSKHSNRRKTIHATSFAHNLTDLSKNYMKVPESTEAIKTPASLEEAIDMLRKQQHALGVLQEEKERFEQFHFGDVERIKQLETAAHSTQEELHVHMDRLTLDKQTAQHEISRLQEQMEMLPALQQKLEQTSSSFSACYQELQQTKAARDTLQRQLEQQPSGSEELEAARTEYVALLQAFRSLEEQHKELQASERFVSEQASSAAAQLEALQKTNAKLTKSAAPALEKEREVLKEKLSKAEREVQSLTLESKKLNKENTQLKRQMTTVEEKRENAAELKLKAKTARHEKNLLENQVKMLTGQLEAAKAKVQQLEETRTKSSAEVSRYEQELKQAEKEKLSVKSKLGALRDLTSQKEELELKVASLYASTSDLEGAAEELRIAKEALATRVEELEAELDHTRMDRDELSSDKEELLGIVEDLEAKNVELSKLLEEMESGMEDSAHQMELLQQRIDDAERAVGEKDAAIRGLKERLEQERQQLLAMADEKQAETHVEFMEKHQLISAENDALKAQLESIQSKSGSLGSDNQELRGLVTELRKSVAIYETEVDTLEKRDADTQTQLSQMRQELQQMQGAMQDTQRDGDVVQKQLSRLQQEHSSLLERYETVSRRNADSRGLQNECEHLTEQLRATEHMLRESSSKAKRLESELLEVVGRLEFLETDNVSKTKRIEHMEEELGDAHKQVQTRTKQAQAHIDELQRRIESLQQRSHSNVLSEVSPNQQAKLIENMKAYAAKKTKKLRKELEHIARENAALKSSLARHNKEN